MKILLSPSKKQELNIRYDNFSQPHLIRKSIPIMNILKELEVDELAKLLNVSENIAKQNKIRNQEWNSSPNFSNGSNAIFVYIGEAFLSLNPGSFTKEDFMFLNENLIIFSGLYGVLKPLDIIMPYRLDIKDRVKIENYKNLYDYWSSDISKYINSELNNNEILINLSSGEYFRSLDLKSIKNKIINPEFKSLINGKLRTVSFWSKHMRGLMARELIKNKITSEKDIETMDLEGYKLDDIKNGRYLYIKREE